MHRENVARMHDTEKAQGERNTTEESDDVSTKEDDEE